MKLNDRYHSKPKGIVDIDAPISGVITDQQVTNAGGVQGLGSSPFTITDLSGNKAPCEREPQRRRSSDALLALAIACSFAFDFNLRLKVQSTMNLFILDA